MDMAPEIDAAAIDADVRACDPAKPFGDVRLVAGLDTANDEGNPSLSADELTIYLFSNRQSPGTADLDAYVATRATRDAAFGALGAITAINTTADERGGSLSTDGLALFFHSSRTGEHDLYVSTRPNLAAPFGAPTSLGAGVNTADHDQTPSISADGQVLYFTRTPAAGGASSIYRASAGPTGFTNATAITELSASAASSVQPTLSADGLTIYFSSDRTGGAGSLDVWVATRPSLTAAFAQITNVTELNSDRFEFLDWISPDGCRVYFTSGRNGGGWDTWQATRPL
ncbi:MAG: TolB family protein [Kofleriaceae bacterium]